MTNLSDLHLHRTVVNGKGTNTSSRYRAIKKVAQLILLLTQDTQSISPPHTATVLG